MKTKTPKPLKKSRVTRITLAALFNTGNYEHVRYEITSEVPSGGSAKQTMLDTMAILAALKPVKKPYDLEAAKAVLAKTKEEMSAYEIEHYQEYVDKVGQYEAAISRRKDALHKLDDVGGSRAHKDAKQDWDNADLPF